MFKGHPKGLAVLFFSNMGERFGFYTMLSVFTYYLMENFGWTEGEATNVYGIFMGILYVLPVAGGLIAESLLGYGRTVLIGIIIMMTGYFVMAVPSDSVFMLWLSLGIIAVGTGLFKGNIVVLVGNLYDRPEYGSLRDSAFNIYYMGINIGAFFAPYAATAAKNYFTGTMGMTVAEGYNAAFAVSAFGQLFSLMAFTLFRKHYKSADVRATVKKGAEIVQSAITPEQERQRVVALLIVFAIVIFFWMAFQQNGAALSLFAKYYTELQGGPGRGMLFDLVALLAIVAVIGGLYFVFRGKTGTVRMVAGGATLAAVVVAWLRYSSFPEVNTYDPELFQSFNPLFIVFLTPAVLAAFAWLNARGKEPSSPGKIGIGMLITAIAFGLLLAASLGLPVAETLDGKPSPVLVSPYWLISAYLTMTVAELFLSPMGLSFVSKVAPPRLKGLMQGLWLCAVGVGNYLAGFIGKFYESWELWQFFAMLAGAMLLSALAIAVMLKRLKAATA
jgi:POT family proton-dependent oligopeptide transporter